MRRGLIDWSREELPVATLDARIGRLQDAMRRDGLGVVLMYTSIAQPAAAHWVSNFTPYWSEALLVLFPQGKPMLLAALTPRVHPWIRDVSHLGEVVSAPRLGVSAATLIAERVSAEKRVGVVGLEEAPASVMQPLAGLGERLVDVTQWFAALRQPADEAEVGLFRTAASKAQAALRAVPAGARSSSAVTAAVEASARLAGAEEVLQRVAPDLQRSATLQRVEGDLALGQHWAVEVSMAYKGVWVRAGRCMGEDPPASWTQAQSWFERVVAQLGEGAGASAWRDAPGVAEQWTLEACTDVHPLRVIATGSDAPPAGTVPAGTPLVLSVRLALPDGPWWACAPVVPAVVHGR